MTVAALRPRYTTSEKWRCSRPRTSDATTKAAERSSSAALPTSFSTVHSPEVVSTFSMPGGVHT
eukprot:366048-Chlamydomonas_euryale.AAC.15